MSAVAKVTPRPRTKFCWQCGKKLASQMTQKGRIYHFALFKDQAGNVHAVHNCCWYTLEQQRPITAQPRNADESTE